MRFLFLFVLFVTNPVFADDQYICRGPLIWQEAGQQPLYSHEMVTFFYDAKNESVLYELRDGLELLETATIKTKQVPVQSVGLTLSKDRVFKEVSSQSQRIGFVSENNKFMGAFELPESAVLKQNLDATQDSVATPAAIVTPLYPEGALFYVICVERH